LFENPCESFPLNAGRGVVANSEGAKKLYRDDLAPWPDQPRRGARIQGRNGTAADVPVSFSLMELLVILEERSHHHGQVTGPCRLALVNTNFVDKARLYD